ncbi:enterobactin synthetase component D [Rhizobium mongolense subsp. loessense]|uniref:Enterobactin synthetase component D n=1 Tax=Rhizobium mongolense subsp. loessense TaxID=158890 RepID=A0A1G4QZQ2_9HYPH|nr:enterobactin synthetase component D [Rhizobium mongolense subsp. loessense]
MDSYLSHLHKRSGDFLGDIVILSEKSDKLVAVEAQYDVHAYMPSLFETYDIDVPPTLINAVPKRQSEFLAGRILSRVALERLHQPSASISIGK